MRGQEDAGGIGIAAAPEQDARQRSGPPALYRRRGCAEAKLPSDGFSLVDPLDAGALRRDFVFEIAGHRRHPGGGDVLVVGQEAHLVAEQDNAHDSDSVRIDANGVTIGYANRLQAPTLRHWLETRSVRARLLRLNGTQERPRAFVFLRVCPLEGRGAA